MMKKFCQFAMVVIAIPSVTLSQNLPKLVALSERIKPEVSSIRSLNFVWPFTLRYQSDAEIYAFISGEFSQSVPQAILQNYDLIIRTIGFHQGGVPLSIETITQATQSQIAAYYDPATRSVNFPIRASSTEELAPILVHELVHVLQDQHFGLDHLIGDAANSDELSARQALAEGDATLVQFLWIFAELGQEVSDAQLQPTIDMVANMSVDEIKRTLMDAEADLQVVQEIEEIPDFLLEQQLGAYSRGLAFVFALKRRGGWTGVNRAYANPPLSMEHILHPAKYIAGESVEEIAFPDLANETFTNDWELLDTDTLGELGFRIIFNTFDVNTTSHPAAEGWHGDRYAVFKHRRENTPALVLFTTWDTEQDATEFKTAYQDVLAIKRRGATDFRIEQRGADVLIAESPRDLDLFFAYLEKVQFTSPFALDVFDFDGDLVIGFTDFLAFAAQFGTSSSDPDFDPRFDIDADGMVGFSDFLAFAAAFGKEIVQTRNTKSAVVIDPHFIHRVLGFDR